MSSAAAFVKGGMLMKGVQPRAGGYGIASDPVHECSYNSLFAAAELASKEHWRAMEVERASCHVEDRQGYTLRKMKLKASGERFVERITIHEESGSAMYNER